MSHCKLNLANVRTEFTFFETAKRNYRGVTLDRDECIEHRHGAVKDNLIDREFAQKATNIALGLFYQFFRSFCC